MTEKLLLSTRKLRKAFQHEGRTINVLNGVDLDIAPGERIAVVGKSGAGKSTLLHILGALDTPTSGEIWFEGVDLLKMSPREMANFRNEHIGFMFQFHHLLAEFTAIENVMMPALIGRRTRSEAERDAHELLDAVGLSERLRHRPSELSGGEQQRVALARALMGKPKLLLADEPTGNLDSQTSDGIHALFEFMNQTFGTAMLIVTHNQDLARKMPRQMRMADGQLVQDSGEAA
ncbi:MAG: ABC transporter ATP-binding protein [Myxococcota bacterium]|nr:ABC transporter ATP-binding protein [Myxococcota bacterium]